MSHDVLHTRNEIILVVVVVINYNIHTYNRSQWSVRKQTNKQTVNVTCSNEMSRMSANLISRKHRINMQR